MVLAKKSLRKCGRIKRATFHAAVENSMTAKGKDSFPSFVFLCFRYEKNTYVIYFMKSVDSYAR